MRILLITTGLGLGGAERSFSRLGRDLSQHHDVHSVVFNLPRDIPYPIGGKISELGFRAKSSLVSKGFTFIKRAYSLHSLKESFMPHCSVSFLEGADLLNVFTGYSDEKIVSIRGSKLYDGNLRGPLGLIRRRILIPLVLRRGRHFVCITQGLKLELQHIYGVPESKCSVIYNGFALEELRHASREPTTPEFQRWASQPHLTIFSRLNREKLPMVSSQIFISLRDVGYNGRLLVIGEGPYKDAMVSYFKRRSLRVHEGVHPDFLDDVVFTGGLTNPHNFLLGSDLLYLATESEGGFPNSLGEALALGIPVAVSDSPWGPRELLLDKAKYPFESTSSPIEGCGGLLLPYLTPESQQGEPNFDAWISSLSLLLRDPVRLECLRLAGLRRIAEFDVNQNTRKWSELFQSILKI